MLNKFYCLREYDESTFGISLPERMSNVVITHLVDFDKPNDLSAILQQQYDSHGNFPFSLAIKNFSPDSREKLTDLLTLFFHPYYHTHFYGKLLFIYGLYPDEPIPFSLFSDLFGQQKINVRLIPVSERKGEHLQERLIRMNRDKIHEETDWEDLSVYYYNYCSHSYDSDDVFVLGPVRTRSIGSIETDIQSASIRLQNVNPWLSSVISRNAAMKIELANFMIANRQLAEEKKILKDLLDLSKKHNEVDYILNFYKNEYEILPLWFKRLGHIVKVLMGKRTFKSLFNDNVKRYNN